MSFDKSSNLLRFEDGHKTINGSWLYDLGKKYYPDKETKVFFYRIDEIGRIEIAVKIELFEKLKTDNLFVMKAEKLTRLRKDKNWGILDFFLRPEIKCFDNDLQTKKL